jgi:hypothetical protein
MNNLKHNSFRCIYSNSLHVSNNLVLIIRRIDSINTASGIYHSVSVTVSCAGQKGILACFVIPDGCIVLIQFCCDVLVFVYLFCIAKCYILLTLHFVMILGKWPTWCTILCCRQHKFAVKHCCATVNVFNNAYSDMRINNTQRECIVTFP